jgi:hypothetical protein
MREDVKSLINGCLVLFTQILTTNTIQQIRDMSEFGTEIKKDKW